MLKPVQRARAPRGEAIRPAAALICLLLTGCTTTPPAKQPAAAAPPAKPAYFRVDPATAGTITGHVMFTGKPPQPKPVSMEADSDCQQKQRVRTDESVVLGKGGSLGNAFVYVKAGLQGKTFEPPPQAVTIDQNGCWFTPHVLGIQVGQQLKVTNSDPVTHNIHPVAQVNREWNQSQSPGAEPLERQFSQPEIMVPVRCNIHRWMRAYIGVVDHPYFAVTPKNGRFTWQNVPPGTYTLALWHELLGTQEQQITVAPRQTADVQFTLKGD